MRLEHALFTDEIFRYKKISGPDTGTNVIKLCPSCCFSIHWDIKIKYGALENSGQHSHVPSRKMKIKKTSFLRHKGAKIK